MMHIDRDIWSTLTPADLPGDLCYLARPLGMDVARYLVETWGGIHLYVPSAAPLRGRWDALCERDLPGDLAEIARDMGMGVARRLVEEWGGLMLYIPVYSTIYQTWLRGRVRSEFDGRNAGALARRYGVPRRYIHHLVDPPRRRPQP